ncbi:MAG: hypothetical protein JW875_00845 [Spirochaetales bacterium]|nr:hypothetical protein [Spirochaetales bacterium]
MKILFRLVFFVIAFNLIAEEIIKNPKSEILFEFPVGMSGGSFSYNSDGNEPGCPTDIDVDSDGNYYFVDFRGSRIVLVDSDFNFFQEVKTTWVYTDIELTQRAGIVYSLSPFRFAYFKKVDTGIEILFESGNRQDIKKSLSGYDLHLKGDFIIGVTGRNSYWSLQLIDENQGLQIQYRNERETADLFLANSDPSFTLMDNGILKYQNQIISSDVSIVEYAFGKPVIFSQKNGTQFIAAGKIQGWDREGNMYGAEYGSLYIYDNEGNYLAGMSLDRGPVHSLRYGITQDGNILFLSSSEAGHKLRKVKRFW